MFCERVCSCLHAVESKLLTWEYTSNYRLVNDTRNITVKSGVLFPPNIATLPLILEYSCANCTEQVAPKLASCNHINFNKYVDFNIFLADFR